MNKDFRLEKHLLILDPSNSIEKREIEFRKTNTYYNKILSSSKNENVNNNIAPMHITPVKIPIQKPMQKPILKIMPNGMLNNNKKLKMVII